MRLWVTWSTAVDQTRPSPHSLPLRAASATLVDSAERGGLWTLQTSVFPENAASLALLRRFGFRVVGTRERIARQHGFWRDTVLVERRSEVVT